MPRKPTPSEIRRAEDTTREHRVGVIGPADPDPAPPRRARNTIRDREEAAGVKLTDDERAAAESAIAEVRESKAEKPKPAKKAAKKARKAAKK